MKKPSKAGTANEGFTVCVFCLTQQVLLCSHLLQKIDRFIVKLLKSTNSLHIEIVPLIDVALGATDAGLKPRVGAHIAELAGTPIEGISKTVKLKKKTPPKIRWRSLRNYFNRYSLVHDKKRIAAQFKYWRDEI